MKFTNKGKYQRHFNLLHKAASIYQCRYWILQFELKRKLDLHVTKDHENIPYSCLIWLKEYKCLSIGIKHVNHNHNEIIGDDTSKSHLLLNKSRNGGDNWK